MGVTNFYFLKFLFCDYNNHKNNDKNINSHEHSKFIL